MPGLLLILILDRTCTDLFLWSLNSRFPSSPQTISTAVLPGAPTRNYEEPKNKKITGQHPMYLARNRKNKAICYMIRHSFLDGDIYKSRDLFDLGEDPARFIVYPGGNGFYIDPEVEDAIEKKGLSVSQDDLETVFWDFIDPEIKRAMRGFQRSDTPTKKPADGPVHMFDKRRLVYLKSASVDQRNMNAFPDTFFDVLRQCSRDEIEQYFMRQERILKAKELRTYVYVIFDLQRHFSKIFKHHTPAALDPGKMDDSFVKEICDLNTDRGFWAGMKARKGLKAYLKRYAIMYFDNDFPEWSPMADYIRDFMNRHRRHQPPQSVRVGMAEAAELFQMSEADLKKLDVKAFTRVYRKRALKLHPDMGGSQETFVKLNAAFQKMLRYKKRR